MKYLESDKMKVKIRNIDKSILESEQCEDYTDFVHLLAEARAVNALAFFEIDYDDTRDTVEVSDAFDYDEAINIVNVYLEIVEADGERPADIVESVTIPDSIEEREDYVHRIHKEAERYDDFTESSRGADDGTFDYAGTYVISILSILQTLSKR